MFCDGAKSTTPKTTAHDVDAETNHFPRRNFGVTVVATVCIGIHRMWTSGVGQIKHQIHFSGGQWNRWWVDPDIARSRTFTMGLHQTTRIAWISL